MKSCIHIPTCHLHTPLTHYTPSLTPHTSTLTHGTGPGTSSRGRRSLALSTLKAEEEARAGWVTSGWCIRKEPNSILARKSTALQSTIHQCLLFCLLVSDSLNFRSIKFLPREAKRHIGLCGRVAERTKEAVWCHWEQSESTKIFTSVEESGSLLPAVWKFE